MHEILFALLVAALFCGSVFALPSKKNMISAVIGLPLGLSYSRQLTDLIELDFLAGLDVAMLKYELSGENWSVSGETAGVVLSVRVAPLFRL